MQHDWHLLADVAASDEAFEAALDHSEAREADAAADPELFMATDTLCLHMQQAFGYCILVPWCHLGLATTVSTLPEKPHVLIVDIC